VSHHWNPREPLSLQATAACAQLARCASAARACADVAVATPGALPALVRLVRACNRSRPHAALLAAALAALKLLAACADGGAALAAADAAGVLAEKLQIFRDEPVRPSNPYGATASDLTCLNRLGKCQLACASPGCSCIGRMSKAARKHDNEPVDQNDASWK